tara:strand:- start:512 stop:1351 length:840 start_codon:yes stop_codon:yes gene_type:complete
MQLLIDNREPNELIKYLINLNINSKNNIEIITKPLPLGDFIIYDEINDNNIIIFERKSLKDLEASIKDGRYNEQSLRLSNEEIHNHNIYYIIEGSIINYHSKIFKNTLYSTLVSLSYYKGFSVLTSLNNIETCEIIYAFVNKILKEKKREPYYNIKHKDTINCLHESIDKNQHYEISLKNESYLEDESKLKNETSYLNVIKTVKKSNITKDNINTIMLMQIPSISVQTASAIINKYKTIYQLILALNEDENCLYSLKLENSNRKISKNIVNLLKDYLIT